MIAAVISLGGIGFLAAVILGFAAKKFAVEVDPREAEIAANLPGANCGACGYAGCGGYAKAVVAGSAPPNLCTPGGAGAVAMIARVMGVEATAAEPTVAVICCQGDNTRAKDKYKYVGVHDCRTAQALAGGPKACPGGCLGLGTCVAACAFGALSISPGGLAVVDREKCVGCKKCTTVCPRNVIKMAPKSATVQVLCNSHDKGAVIKSYCQVGCIGCQICKKTAEDVYAVDNFLASVKNESYDQEKAVAGMLKCPAKCIHDLSAAGTPQENEAGKTEEKAQ